MAHSYEYAVLTAVPNPRRGERVNVGIIVFRPDGFDVRFKQAEYKLRALTGDSWKARIESAEMSLKSLFDPNQSASDALEKIKIVDPLFQPSGLGFLKPASEDEYNILVEQILASLVALPPKREKAETKTRINTEIASAFRKVNILAKKDETIEDNKVVPNFVIDSDEGLIAPFALKNGKLIVTSTLDLRKSSTGLAESALSSIILDKAKRRYNDDVKTLGVYAVDRGMKENFGSLLNLLNDYADDLFDWSDIDGNRRFRRTVYDALKVEGEWLLDS
jgi:hypothetical protein